MNVGVALDRDISPKQDDKATPQNDDKAAESNTRQQRVVVIGDGDFLSNGFLGMGGNLQLGMNIFNWLSSDDAFISIPVKTAPDISLQFTNTDISVVGFGFLLILPLVLLGSGVVIWVRRRRR